MGLNFVDIFLDQASFELNDFWNKRFFHHGNTSKSLANKLIKGFFEELFGSYINAVKKQTWST